MSLLRWRREFEVGIEEVDHEHRELLELINGLHDMMQAGADYVQVVELIGDIYAQIAAHFALEEKMMRDTHYPSLAEHREDHETLLDDLREFMDEVEEDGSFDSLQLSQDLNRWFGDHFQTHDAQLHQSAPKPKPE